MVLIETLTTLISSYGLIFVAEMGDKSQLVCMALAARYRHMPVMLGAAAAFILLNSLAVIFGASLVHFIPVEYLTMAVAVLFLVFGLMTMFAKDEEEGEGPIQAKSHSIFITTFSMLFLAEMGDKTQIAVAGLAVTLEPWPVWLGANLALISTSALGIWLGTKYMKKLPVGLIHKVSGVFFIAMAVFAASRLI